jgi:UDP-N-acetylmuramoyl-L-alanyl-D-glutamate--2,6-diaminopimelate ligase
MESLLTTIREYKPMRIVSLFGCGGNRSKLRRYEMGEISGKYADLSIITADNSRFENVMDIIEDIKVGINKTNGDYVIIPDRKEAIKYSIVNAKEGDIVLLLGKGHEDYQEIEGVRYPFDERVIIKEILEELKEENITV